MRSWVFRHRARLRVIYGLPFPLPADEAVPEEVPEPAPRARPKKVRRSGLEPGMVARRGRYVVIAPMDPPTF